MTRRSLLVRLLIGILLTAVLTACGGQPAAGQPTADINLTVAAGAQTMVAAVFQTQTAIAPTITNTAPATPTSLPSSTAPPLVLSTATNALFPTQAILYAASPTPTGTYYTATPLASSLASGCYNLRLINSYRSPDGTLLPGQDFTQSWQVENNGTCEWLYVYEVVYVSGDKMGEATAVRLGKRIEPGKWTTISLLMHAPNKTGTFKASWQFSDGGGKKFGASLPVEVTVKSSVDPTKTPDAVQTTIAGTVVKQMTETAEAQQTALSVGQTAIACQATQTAGGTCPP